MSTLTAIARPTSPITLPSARALRQVLYISMCGLLSALLIFGPLALGVVQYWSIALFEGAALCLGLLWMASQLSAESITIRWSPLFAPSIAFFIVVMAQIVFHRTAYRYDSLSEAWLYVAYCIILFVSVQILSRAGILHFARLVAAASSGYAAFAILQGFTSANKIYWRILPRAGFPYGSYVNHNHYAGLIELALPISLMLAFNGSTKGAVRGLLIFTSTLMFGSVFLSQSRAGMATVVAEVFSLTILWAWKSTWRATISVAISFCLATAILLTCVAPEQVSERMADLHDAARLQIYKDSVQMFRDRPLLGTGFGTFATVFPRYRTSFDGFLINHAHNDYLEILLETGLFGFGAAVWFLVLLYREGFRHLARCKRSPEAMLSMAALVSCIGMLIHSFVDFNLHIPGNAALFCVMCAAATLSPPRQQSAVAVAHFGELNGQIESIRPQRVLANSFAPLKRCA
jgi:O-antigen ligase